MGERAHRPQGWVVSGQRTTTEEAQPHPSADNWIKVLLSKALPTRARLSFLRPLPFTGPSSLVPGGEQSKQSRGCPRVLRVPRRLAEGHQPYLNQQTRKLAPSPPHNGAVSCRSREGNIRTQRESPPLAFDVSPCLLPDHPVPKTGLIVSPATPPPSFGILVRDPLGSSPTGTRKQIQSRRVDRAVWLDVGKEGRLVTSRGPGGETDFPGSGRRRCGWRRRRAQGREKRLQGKGRQAVPL